MILTPPAASTQENTCESSPAVTSLRADAVVITEHTQELEIETIKVRKSLAPGGNAILHGENALIRAITLPRGYRLRPQEIGLFALGYSRAQCTHSQRPPSSPLGMK
ncbi:hypothetical protein DSUL_50267 [Desulfovibrionales bacterium]